ncbi:MAG: hypothetical protein V7776_22625 [Halopseudomonas aestusnigri]
MVYMTASREEKNTNDDIFIDLTVDIRLEMNIFRIINAHRNARLLKPLPWGCVDKWRDARVAKGGGL